MSERAVQREYGPRAMLCSAWQGGTQEQSEATWSRFGEVVTAVESRCTGSGMGVPGPQRNARGTQGPPVI